MTIRFTKANHEALKTAAAVDPSASINSLVNTAVASYFTQPTVVASLRTSYSNFVSETTSYAATIDRLAGTSNEEGL